MGSWWLIDHETDRVWLWMSCTSLTLAGRYRLAERIATGGIGEVWRGLDVLLERPVAIKLLRAEHVADPWALARFRAEARHAGALSHHGIARIYDYGAADPPHPPYLVMELVAGLSLAELLAGGPLDPAHAMDVIAQAAAGLGAAHLAGLVHCDIKPGNLLLTPDGQVKIADFGIAQVAGVWPDPGPGILLGTPAYLAPELVAGAPATAASDLYALGIVAYECLAGMPAFAGTPSELMLAHRDLPVPPLPASVPAEVAALVAELTAKNKAARPASANEVARRAGALRDHLSGLPAASQRSWPSPRPATTLTDLPLPLKAGRTGRPGLRPSSRLAIIGGLATVALAVLGLMVAIALTAASPGRQAAAPARAVVGRPVAAVRTVEVPTAQLAGQPVGAVRRQLQQLGLSVRVFSVRTDQQPAGTVLSVLPSGLMPVGGVVTVIAAVQAHVAGPSTVPGHVGQGNGGDGNGGGHGDGIGGGGGGGGGV